MVDIQNTFRPLILVVFILGLGNLRYSLSYWKYRLSVFYIIMVWSFYAFAFYIMIKKFSPISIFNNSLTFISISTNILVTIISVTITGRKQQKIHMCIKKLCLVNDTLEKLGTPKEYHTIKKLIRLILIIYFIMVLILFTTDSIWNIEKHNNINAMIISLIVGYPFYVNTITDITVACFLRYVGTRIDEINGYIEQLSDTEKYGLRCKWKKSLIIRYYVRNAENRKHVLWIIMHLHSELRRIAHEMNDLFGTQFTLQMLAYFIIFVTTFYVQYHMILCLTQRYTTDLAVLKLILSTDMWCMVLLTKFISLNYICESVSAKLKETTALIHKLTDLKRFPETREEIIYQFLLQMILQPLEFRGMGMFHFGYKFINKYRLLTSLLPTICLRTKIIAYNSIGYIHFFLRINKNFKEVILCTYYLLQRILLRPWSKDLQRLYGMLEILIRFLIKFFIWVLSVIVFILQMDSPMSLLLKFNGINETCLK